MTNNHNNMYLQITNDDVKKYDGFLKIHKVEAGSEITHTAMGWPWGAYYIGDKDKVMFLNLYVRAMTAFRKEGIDPAPLHIVERPKRTGPLLIDLDFRQLSKERSYTLDHICYIVSKCNEIIEKYIKTARENVEAFVCEKKQPTYDEKQKNYKDGFHIVYPKIPLNLIMRYKILSEIKAAVIGDDAFSEIEYLNSIDEIFDLSVVWSNGWFMYGSRKPNKQVYKLTHIFSFDMSEQDSEKHDPEELVMILSNRQFNEEDDQMELTEVYDHDQFRRELERSFADQPGIRVKKKKPEVPVAVAVGVAKIQENPGSNLIPKLPKPPNPPNMPDIANDIVLARKFAGVLSKKRATDYHSWIRVGWALRNIDRSLIDAFLDFSRACPEKFEEAACQKIWDDAKDVNGEGFTIASLYLWAKEDDIDGYLNVMRENVNVQICEAERGSHDDIAKVVYEFYKFSYRCANIAKNVWYEFQKHRWVVIDSGYTLANKLSDEVTKEFAKLASQYFAEFAQKQSQGGAKKDDLMDKGKGILKIVEKLKNQAFKHSIVAACANRFYDAKFEEKLDENPFLLGFNNGVYDLKNRCFRNGVPDDYLTMTVGYDYKEFGKNDPVIKDIEAFFKKVHKEDDIRKYILTLVSSYLDGRNKDQKFILWTGVGSNGKSTTIDLISYTFGDYFGVLPVTILTKKRGASSNATPELADKRGKRFLAIQEPEHDDLIYVGLMKELTGSDWVVARALYGNPFRYKPQFKLVLTCNKLPQIPSSDGGTWRRLRVTPWESEFVDGVPNPEKNQYPKDMELSDKLKKWNQGFIWLLLKQYYPDYIDVGLKEPKKVTQFTDKYKKTTDIYYEYLAEHMEITKKDTDSESLNSMYASFKSWYTEGYSKNSLPNRKEFLNYLLDSGYKHEKGSIKGMRYAAKESVL
ncbi:MAG: D5-like helicase-primase [Harvfovirus sp.]|uniref:D5-like helicase-primase n=1 Tax=Harvfovirus sp. TaxID=2487768 RepID=A0A3G5A1V4_9VIRU|nr:MAG: D5-like helicase-primase [Harvfovirus sp.]